MEKKKYVFDNDSFNVGDDERKGRKLVSAVIGFFVASVSVTVIYYLIFALLFSTESERALKNENRMLEKMYPEMERKARILDGAVEGLKQRDRGIYEDIFETDAPEIESLADMNFMALTDSTDEDDIVKLTEIKAGLVMKSAMRVEENMLAIFNTCTEEGFSLPPMHLPLEVFTMSMTGASTGARMNPFYKVIGEHDGIDFMAPIGSAVVASADGTVVSVSKSGKGPGNVVTIDHGNGYETEYAHLQDIQVSRYRTVKRGDVIGHVGMSGSSYAPHLHYEVRKDGAIQDPVNYFFGSLDPMEYGDMVVVSAITGQSLD